MLSSQLSVVHPRRHQRLHGGVSMLAYICAKVHLCACVYEITMNTLMWIHVRNMCVCKRYIAVYNAVNAHKQLGYATTGGYLGMFTHTLNAYIEILLLTQTKYTVFSSGVYAHRHSLHASTPHAPAGAPGSSRATCMYVYANFGLKGLKRGSECTVFACVCHIDDVTTNTRV
jgi:hypothetical protein